MSERRTNGKRSTRGGGELRPMRLVLEPLEARRLLASLDFACLDGQNMPAQPILEAASNSGNSVSNQTSPQGSGVSASQSDPTNDYFLPAEGEGGLTPFFLSEDATLGALVGPIDFVAPGIEEHYTLYSADPRFEIEDNRLFFSDGKLDFESEPDISFAVNAVNDSSEVVATSITTITIGDVNEPPQAIELSGGTVLEHDPGADIGNLTVIDPDGSGNYVFFLFDSRFVLAGHRLKLADGVSLDYDSEPEILLAIAANDGHYEIFDTVRIEVLPRNTEPISVSSVELDPQRVPELTPGATVGTASIVNPQDSVYTFSVSDSRFEMLDDQLKLRVDQQVNALSEPTITLTLTAVGSEGDEASGTFTIEVYAIRSFHHNYNLNEDVNGDGYVSPIDALLIINDLNANGSRPILGGGGATGEPPINMIDVNGDGLITPMDVLLVINHLNDTRSPSRQWVETPLAPISPDTNSSGNDASGQWAPLPLDPIDSGELSSNVGDGTPTLYDISDERRRLENALIDAELEVLLDQLSEAQTRT